MHENTSEAMTINVSQVAQRTGLSERYVFCLVKQKQIPHFRVGRRLLFSVAALEDWVEKKTRESTKA